MSTTADINSSWSRPPLLGHQVVGPSAVRVLCQEAAQGVGTTSSSSSSADRQKAEEPCDFEMMEEECGVPIQGVPVQGEDAAADDLCHSGVDDVIAVAAKCLTNPAEDMKSASGLPPASLKASE